MRNALATLLTTVGLSLASSAAHAHVSVSTAAPAVAGATVEASFGVGHGCDGLDTYSVKVQIPAGVTGVMPVDNVFGKATVEKQDGVVTAVTWTRPSAADVLPADSHYHKLSLRMKLPATPFKTLFFPTIQTCGAPGSAQKVTEWVGMESEHNHGGASDAGAPAGPSPAPALFVHPPRFPGWNKYTVQEHVHDLTVFKDAQIVWAGTAAYSPNPATMSLIMSEPDTQVLSLIHPGTEIWVKF